MNPWLYPIVPTSQLIQSVRFINDDPGVPAELILSRARSEYLTTLYTRLAKGGYELPSARALEAFVTTGYRHDRDLGAHRYDFSFPGVQWHEPYEYALIDSQWRHELRAHPGGPIEYVLATPASTGDDPDGDYPTETRQLTRYLDLHKGTIVTFCDWQLQEREKYDSRATQHEMPEGTR